MKKVLVTGALGFCARHLIKKIREKNDPYICGIDVFGPCPADSFLDEFSIIDVCDRKGLERYIAETKPDTIFHLAGTIGNDLFRTYHVNFTGSLNLIDVVKESVPGSRVLLVGSSAEYGLVPPDEFPITEECRCRPFSAYGISKHAMVLMALEYARSHKLKIVIARPFNVMGPGIPATLVVGAVIKRVRDSVKSTDRPVIKMGNLDTQRDFIDVEDTVDAYIKMVEGESWGEVFNICSGEPCSIRRIVEIISSFTGMPVTIEQDQALIRHSDIQVSYGSHEKATKVFGFRPSTDIEKTLYETWKHYVEREG